MSFSRAHFSILTLPMTAAKCNGYSCGEQWGTYSGTPHLPERLQKLEDLFTGQRQRLVVVYQEGVPTPQPIRPEALSLRVAKVEPARVPSRKLRGVPPQLTHLGEPDAGPDALHVREDHGRDIQVGIERGLVRVELALTASELHGGVARARVGGSVVALSAPPSVFWSVDRHVRFLPCHRCSSRSAATACRALLPTRLTARERTAPEREDTMAKRKAAPPEEDSEEEEYYEDDLEDGSDEDEDGEAAAGGGRDFDEEEDDDDELEAEMLSLIHI